MLYLAWRVWRTTAQRPAAPEPGSSGEDSDAVVDELAGDFTDAPDRLLARVGCARTPSTADCVDCGPVSRRSARVVTARLVGSRRRGLSVVGDRI